MSDDYNHPKEHPTSFRSHHEWPSDEQMDRSYWFFKICPRPPLPKETRVWWVVGVAGRWLRFKGELH